MRSFYGIKLDNPLMLGTVGYPSPAILAEAFRASGAGVATVSLRREGTGGAGQDFLAGNGGADLLRGGGGRDDLEGGGGRDTLNGGRSADELTGGGGRDVFQFRTGDGFDRITDFQQDRDRIEILRGADAFNDLDISQSGDDVLISFANVRVLVEDQDEGDFAASDFIF